MVRDNWNPLRLFGCLSARNKGYSRLCGKTLGGRIGKKGTRPIPKAFVDRFMECYAVSDLPDAPVKKAVIDYYTKELANGDYDFDPSKAEYPGIFKQQLEAVKVKNLKASESRQGISHDNQWHVIETLGKGSYGDPFNFALKETCNDKFWADYCSEGELTRRLNVSGCPNVVTVHDWIKTHDPTGVDLDTESTWEKSHRFRILYNHHEHGDLHELISYYHHHELIFPESFVWHIIHQVATALLYCAHGQPTKRKNSGWESIVHMDIKSSNILLGPSPGFDEAYPKLLLADFGLAHTIPNEEVRAYKKAFPRGTPDFTAPEVRDTRSSDKISIASDIYSLGITLERIMEDFEYRVYTKREVEIIRQKQDTDPYLPFTRALIHTKETCTRDSPGERPNIFDLWQESRKQAMKWAEIVLKNRLAAFEQGSEFYNGMVLFERSMQQRVSDNSDDWEEFHRETLWATRHRDRVQEIREESSRERAELLALKRAMR